MVKLSEVVSLIEDFAPKQLQESYDNSGLLVNSHDNSLSGALLTLDVTEAVVDEAVQKKCNLIIAHHPLIFGKLTRISTEDIVGRAIIKAIKHDIAIYAAHTNMDNVKNGVSYRMADKIGLKNVRVLSPVSGKLGKLVTFCPNEHIEKIRKAVFAAGAGWIGNYSETSYNLEGTGTFKGEEGADPFVGKKGERHAEKEIRFETIYPLTIEKQVIQALKKAHPYEEVAYDLYPLRNDAEHTGFGAIGELENPMKVNDFLHFIKKQFHTGCIRYTQGKNKIKKVAMCGGSGSFLFSKAAQAGADAFISADFKYHDFFADNEKTMILDIGHYESEQFTSEIFHEIISQKFPTFAVQISKISTNPVKYF